MKEFLLKVLDKIIGNLVIAPLWWIAYAFLWCANDETWRKPIRHFLIITTLGGFIARKVYPILWWIPWATLVVLVVTFVIRSVTKSFDESMNNAANGVEDDF